LSTKTSWKEYAVVSLDDALYRFRVRVFALAHELGSVRAACRAMGIHPSTYYRWRAQVLRHGFEVLRPRERREPRMPNAISPMVEQRILAFALGHPGLGPNRIAAELARPKWGGIKVSANGVWRVLRRHGLNTRAKRLGLVAGYAAPAPEPIERAPQAERHLDVDHPGQLVQMDCFCVGRLSGTRGVVWQYTAIDVASAYTWAELWVTPKNPSPRWTSELAKRVAADLAERGWRLEAVMTDHGAEFKSSDFDAALARVGARQCSSARDDPRPTAASNACRAPSSRNAGSPPLPATSSPSRSGCATTSTATCATTTPTAHTPAAGPAAEPPTQSSERPRCGRASTRASQQLGGGTA
jgi:transposase